MNSSAAEIDLKLREDFRRYLLEYGIESTVVDPVLAVLFRTLATQIYSLCSDTDSLKTALLDELLEGLGFARRFAHPAQLVVRYRCEQDPIHVGAGTVLTGETDSGERMSFATDYGITASSARIAAVFVYRHPSQGNQGDLRLLSGLELPAETIRADPSYGPVPAQLGAHPAIYIAIENLGESFLSRHGIFLQTSPEATLLNAHLERENWHLASREGRFDAKGTLRPHSIHAGQNELRWLLSELPVSDVGITEAPSLPPGFWRGRCFVLPSMSQSQQSECDVPFGMEGPVRAIFGRAGMFIRPRAWLRIPLDSRVEPLHTALTTVCLHAQSASNVECVNQTVHFTENGGTIPIGMEAGGRLSLVAPLSITGESGDTYIPEFEPSYHAGVGRYRLQRGFLTLLPGKMPGGREERFANVRLWMARGEAGNRMGVAQLRSFAKAPARGLSVENITGAAGGADGEDLASAQRRFSEAILSRERLITRTDLDISIRSFDPRVRMLDVQPMLVRDTKGLRKLHRIRVSAQRDRFVEPEEEARILVQDLQRFLADRVPVDIDTSVELAWV
jgi:hypothetical protein